MNNDAADDYDAPPPLALTTTTETGNALISGPIGWHHFVFYMSIFFAVVLSSILVYQYKKGSWVSPKAFRQVAPLPLPAVHEAFPAGPIVPPDVAQNGGIVVDDQGNVEVVVGEAPNVPDVPV
uniref:Uncharacterized protein n=1 Tax=Grammatophora oceanica TaxID=210454 RepID=A0A7S1YEA2_9STRA|mmetsp:Transcript_42314/g.62784  ORF Transcript_42314/g.62784 Transcript_42314/m.62784 type:complete len:123 (+) Transcript_42314:202-570(+)|eukprot:CAMPEP_0194032434 /NCGR_PEP_ID=MMETSP0009_2-20130614/5374_1 /TAXON_ID=210454 /ORGANISM="Grammatophora oceanica, Strain CCMP 410" /LENGTH=122 /DNA_ID=CAMNT_0038672879 /DNA_START=181 /DNA_END=549 /DNA_ORIENTATION=+